MEKGGKVVKPRIPLAIIVSGFALALAASPADAQATRTWVSGVGDDVNPCSRTAPCKTFAGAIPKTAAGGEINCLDPGGFGSVVITQSITIDCSGTLGSILASNTNGVVVNGVDIVVALRNISINGAGNGNIGVRFLNGRSLHISNSTIFGFQTPTSVALSMEAGGGASAHIENTTIFGNRAGIQVRPGSGAASVMLVGSAVTGSGTFGLRADGAGAQVRVGDTTISGNGVGVQTANGGSVASYGDNRLNGNASDGNFTGTNVPRR